MKVRNNSCCRSDQSHSNNLVPSTSAFNSRKVLRHRSQRSTDRRQKPFFRFHFFFNFYDKKKEILAGRFLEMFHISVYVKTILYILFSKTILTLSMICNSIIFEVGVLRLANHGVGSWALDMLRSHGGRWNNDLIGWSQIHVFGEQESR